MAGWTALRRALLYRWWCGMTCRGGSERRRCPCKSPTECRMAAGDDALAHELASRLERLRYSRPQTDSLG